MNSMRRLTAILLIAALAAFAAVGIFEAVANAGVGTGPVPTYHQSASGDTVRVTRGTAVLVDLRAASGTPYEWVVVKGKHSSKFKIVSRRTVSDGSGLPGAPYRTIWKLRATHLGTGTFKVVLREVSSHQVARRFTLHVHSVNPDAMLS